ncbi:DUF29 domain-containing protein [[Phormidium] sp. LEGE 05292]|uniref:DUF29 domain-containing protein n=1 Tax=[Phormidium] sp. LEGE 05292 TaxID=767427 RepID=UPI002AD5B19F|nr:DUF29 domain-containing protein [Phormidium sp. LEGE 05292]
MEQAKFLRNEDWHNLDIPNLVEEIESLGRQEQTQLESRLEVLTGQLLKWEFQPNKRSKSWFFTIREQRRKIIRLIQRNPSLQPYLPKALTEIYPDALDLALRETSLAKENFPQECPYSLEEILNAEFFPGEQLESDPN